MKLGLKPPSIWDPAKYSYFLFCFLGLFIDIQPDKVGMARRLHPRQGIPIDDTMGLDNHCRGESQQIQGLPVGIGTFGKDEDQTRGGVC